MYVGVTCDTESLRPFKWLRGQRFGPVIAAVAAPPWGWQDANRMLSGWLAKCQGQILQCSPHLDAGGLVRNQIDPTRLNMVKTCLEKFGIASRLQIIFLAGAGCKLLLGPNALHALPTHAAACWNMLKHAETTRLFDFVWGCSCPSLSLKSLNIFKLPDVDKLVESEKLVHRMNLLLASAQLEVLCSWAERNSRRSRWAKYWSSTL